DVINEMRIYGGRNLRLARFDGGEKVDKGGAVIAFGKALALHQPALVQHLVGVQKSIGGYEIDARRGGPAAQKRAQNARGCRFADGDRAGDADDERNLGAVVA